MPGPGTWSAGDILTAADLNAIGTWTTYTPTLVQNGTRTATVNYASYCQINKMVILNVDLTCTTTGSANNVVTVSLPVTGVINSARGSGFFYDSSTTDVILTYAFLASTTTVGFLSETSTTTTGFGSSPNVTLGNNDVISFSIVYLAA